MVFGIGVSGFLVSAAIMTAVLVVNSGEPLGFSQLITATGVAMSLLAASGLLSGLIWNLFLEQRVRAVRWSRFAGLLPGFGRKPPPDPGSDDD